MSIVTRPYNFSPNQTAYSSQVNANETTLYGVINGGLDSTNISIVRGIQANYITATGGTGAFQAGSYSFTPATSSATPLTITGAPLQSAALQVWASSTAILASVDAAGNINTKGQFNASTWNNTYSTSTGVFVNNANALNITASGIATGNVTASGLVTAQNATINSTVTTASIIAAGGTISGNFSVSNLFVANETVTAGLTSPLLSSPTTLQLYANNLAANVAIYASSGYTDLSIPGPGYITIGNNYANSFAVNTGIGSLDVPCVANDGSGGMNYQANSSGLGHRWFNYNGTTVAGLMTLGITGGLQAVPSGAASNSNQGILPPWYNSNGTPISTTSRIVWGNATLTFTASTTATTTVALSGNAVSPTGASWGQATVSGGAGTPVITTSCSLDNASTARINAAVPTAITATITVFYMFLLY